MIPSTLLSVIIFLLFIAPGVFWDHLAIKLSIYPPESAFRETTRVVFSSMVLSALSLEILFGVRMFRPRWFPELRPLLSDPAKYYKSEPILVWRTILIQTLLSLVIVMLGYFRAVRKQGWQLRQMSSWQKVFRSELPHDGVRPYVRIRLASGSVYMGEVTDYSPDFELLDREIVLCQPLFSRTPQSLLAPIPPEWDRVILTASSIESMAVQYRKSVHVRKRRTVSQRLASIWKK